MRYLFILLCFLQTFNALAQDASSVKKFPFQVLYAENAKNKEGQVLKSLDIISVSDILNIGKDGTLSLIHYTGLPLEISEDTTIVIQVLQDALLMSTDNKKSKSRSISRINIDYLFIPSRFQSSKSKLSSTGACHDCGSEMEIIYPPKLEKFTPAVHYQRSLCIKWVSTASKRYQVNITDIYEDSLKSYLTENHELYVTKEEFAALKGREKTLIVTIHDLENNKFSRPTLLKEFSANNVVFPYSCDLKKATFALMAGLYIETLSKDYFIEAEKFFVLASELSDKPFYKEMLTNFKKRTER